jgi:hypothetical protein
MANTFKVLARSRPSTTSEEISYTVPVGKQTLITNILVSNASTSASNFSITIQIGGNAFPIASVTSIPARDSVIIDAKTLIIAGNELRITSGLANNITFHITGLEIDI